MASKFDLTVLTWQQLLYKTALVFPSKELQGSVPGGQSYTLAAGQHEYPFNFKVCLQLSTSITQQLARWYYSFPRPRKLTRASRSQSTMIVQIRIRSLQISMWLACVSRWPEIRTDMSRRHCHLHWPALLVKHRFVTTLKSRFNGQPFTRKISEL